MVKVVIGIGANCGDRENSVRKALEWLKTILIQVKCSEIYETPCVNQTGRPYMNAVVSGVFQSTGIDLEDMLKDKERLMGRTAECKEKGDVPVDLDIVMLDGEIVRPWDYRQKFFRIGFSQING